jgi:AcrR family transcriptional regulator
MEKTLPVSLLQVEKPFSPSRERVLDAALALLGEAGAAGLTVRAVETAAGLPHGTVRHHFGDRAGLVRALFVRVAQRESPPVECGPVAAIEHWLGPGRTTTLARYELFLLAARDPSLRPELAAERERFVALAAQQVGPDAAPAVVAAIDGLVLDALVRGDRDGARVAAMVERLLTRAPAAPR